MVLLPQPERPTSATFCPASTEKETLCSTVCAGRVG